MAKFHVSFLALYLASPIPARAKLLKNTIDKTELIHERHSYFRKLPEGARIRNQLPAAEELSSFASK